MKRIILFALVALPLPVFAQTPYDYYVPLSINLTATYETDTTSGAVTQSSTHTTKVTDATLLQFAAAALSDNLSGYNTLAYDNDTGEVVAFNKSNRSFAELGDLFTVTLPPVWVKSGTTNSVTGSFGYTRQGVITMEFSDGNGNDIPVSGVAREVLSSTTKQASITITLTCTGQGTMNIGAATGAYVVFSGSITGSGSIKF